MGFDLNQFIQNGLVYGGARPSKFDIQASLPSVAIDSAIDPTSMQKLQFSCKAASIPAWNVGEVQIPYFGRKIKSAGDRTFDDWRIDVMLDEDYNTRAMFEAWNNSINRVVSNIMQPGMDVEAYKSSWLVTHYGKDDSVIRQYQLVGAWPRAIGPIQLSWDATDRISEFEVAVAYDWCVPIAASEGSKGNATTFVSTVTANT